MCLIAIAPSGTDKCGETFIKGLLMSAKTNNDGIGLAIRNKKKNIIYTSKGFSDIHRVIDTIKSLKLGKQDELIVHLRKVSSGKKSAENCHPFILSPKEEDIIAVDTTETKCPVVFHNGHFADFSGKDYPFSDTYSFTKRVLRNKEVLSMLNRDSSIFAEIFKPVLGHNKLAFMFPSKPLEIIGEFIEDGGYLFSNKTYQISTIVDRGGNQQALFPVCRDQGRIINVKPKFSMDTPLERTKVHVDITNYDKVVLIANKDLDCGIKKGDRYIFKEFKDDQEFKFLSLLSNPSVFAWVPIDEILEHFDAHYKKSNMDLANEYNRLKSIINPVFKSTIMKLNKRLGVHTRRNKQGRDRIQIKYKDNSIETYYASLVMFLNDYKEMINVPINTTEEVDKPVKITPEIGVC